MRKIILNDTINLFFKLQSAFCKFQTIAASECCLMKLLPQVLFEKYIYILALEMASPGNQHSASCFEALQWLHVVTWYRHTSWKDSRSNGQHVNE